MGCDVKACTKSYHFFCAKNDHAVLHTGPEGIYKYFIKQFQNHIWGTGMIRLRQGITVRLISF